MRVLAVDTALGACQAAVLDGERVLAARSEPLARGHQERIGLTVEAAMAEAALDFGELDRIVVTLGPGSFTGVRVGLAFAKGLALALGKPLVGLGTLEALATSIEAEGPIAAVINPGRGEVHLQRFEGGRASGPPQALSHAEALSGLKGVRRLTAVGPGVALLESLPHVRFVPLEAADPAALARLGARAEIPRAPPRPIYLRAPDARLPA